MKLLTFSVRPAVIEWTGILVPQKPGSRERIEEDGAESEVGKSIVGIIATRPTGGGQSAWVGARHIADLDRPFGRRWDSRTARRDAFVLPAKTDVVVPCIDN